MNRNDQNFIAERIRTQYIEKQSTELDELRRLDCKVKRPVNIFSYIFGSISAIVMGCGMSLVMTDIGAALSIPNPFAVGVTVGIVGLLLALINYPIHKSILNSRKKKYSASILEMSEKILNK